jgi:hypothetical protein
VLLLLGSLQPRVSSLYLPKTALAALAGLYPFPVTVLPSPPAYTSLKQRLQPLQISNQKIWPCKKPFLARWKNFSFTETTRPKVKPPALQRTLCHRNLIAVALPTLVRGLHVVLKPCNPKRSSPFTETRQPGRAAGPMPFRTLPLSMAVIASSMSPTVPGRRFGATAPGPRTVAIISGPMGGRRCLRYGTLLKRGPGVRSSWSRCLDPARLTACPGQASQRRQRRQPQRLTATKLTTTKRERREIFTSS